MKKYISVFRIRFINSLQYRAAAFGEILKSFAWAFMEILAYTALYRTAGNAFPMEFSPDRILCLDAADIISHVFSGVW